MDPDASHHILDRIYDENSIEHRLTEAKPVWITGQVERMDHTIKVRSLGRLHSNDNA